MTNAARIEQRHQLPAHAARRRQVFLHHLGLLDGFRATDL